MAWAVELTFVLLVALVGATAADCSHPKCTWECETLECTPNCSPICEPPRCEVQCEKVSSSSSPRLSGSQIPCANCSTVCEKKVPSCRINCTVCHEPGCPKCFVDCEKVPCHTKCETPAPQCVSVCEDPVCYYHCSPPSPKQCPRPKCRLVCENSDCSSPAESLSPACCACPEGSEASEAFPNCCPCFGEASLLEVASSAAQAPLFRSPTNLALASGHRLPPPHNLFPHPNLNAAASGRLRWGAAGVPDRRLEMGGHLPWDVERPPDRRLLMGGLSFEPIRWNHNRARPHVPAFMQRGPYGGMGGSTPTPPPPPPPALPAPPSMMDLDGV